MAKVTPVLWKHKENVDGHFPIYLRIYAGGKTKYKSLSVYLHPRHWNERTRRVRKSHRSYGEINTLISEKVATAEGAILERQRSDKPLRPRHIKRALETSVREAEAAEEDFLAYCRKRLELMEDTHAHGTVVSYRAAVNKLERFQKKRSSGNGEIPFEQVTPSYLEAFMAHLSSDLSNSVNTVDKNMRSLRALLYKAIRDGHMEQGKNPFFHLSLKTERTSKTPLTKGEVERLQAVDLDPNHTIYHARNAFFFAMYAAGMRWSDVCSLEWKAVRDGRLVYQRFKTGDPKDVKLVPPAKAILSDYEHRRGQRERVFPFLDRYGKITTRKELVRCMDSRRTFVNRKLKTLAKRASVETHVTTHTARHSFATVAVEAGWTIREVQRALGHATAKQTETYLRDLIDDELDDKMEDLFGGET